MWRLRGEIVRMFPVDHNPMKMLDFTRMRGAVGVRLHSKTNSYAFENGDDQSTANARRSTSNA